MVMPKGFLPSDPALRCPDGHRMPDDDGVSPDVFWATLDREFESALHRYAEELDRWMTTCMDEGAPYYWDESEKLVRCTERCGWLFFDGRYLAPAPLAEIHLRSE